MPRLPLLMCSNVEKKDKLKVCTAILNLKSDVPPSLLAASVRGLLEYLTWHQWCRGLILLLVGCKQRREEMCEDSP